MRYRRTDKAILIAGRPSNLKSSQPLNFKFKRHLSQSLKSCPVTQKSINHYSIPPPQFVQKVVMVQQHRPWLTLAMGPRRNINIPITRSLGPRHLVGGPLGRLWAGFFSSEFCFPTLAELPKIPKHTPKIAKYASLYAQS